MFVDDNPEASLDDVLVHYGVKGMRWGPGIAKTIQPVLPPGTPSKVLGQPKINVSVKDAKSVLPQHVVRGAGMAKAILNSGHASVVVPTDAKVWTGTKSFRKSTPPRPIPPKTFRKA